MHTLIIETATAPGKRLAPCLEAAAGSSPRVVTRDARTYNGLVNPHFGVCT